MSAPSKPFYYPSIPSICKSCISSLSSSHTCPIPSSPVHDSPLKNDKPTNQPTSYASPPYARLATRGQSLWRNTPGLQDAYNESGLVIVADANSTAETYVRDSLDNVLQLNAADPTSTPGSITKLASKAAIATAFHIDGGAARDPSVGTGDWGYLNTASGWADAEAAMTWLKAQADATGRIDFQHGTAVSLQCAASDHATITGAVLASGASLAADLVIVAAGAWTPSLVDLRGRAVATGQVLAYMAITGEEQAALGGMTVLLNMSSGMFVIPPRNNVLKVARHGYGYSNPMPVACPAPRPGPEPAAESSGGGGGGEDEKVEISVPRTTQDDPSLCAPPEGIAACKAFLADAIPWLAGREFERSRICWYTDTPSGDWLIDYSPEYKGLFLATGGSGHGFKFLPVIGDAIVDVVLGNIGEDGVEEALREKWAWRVDAVENVVTEDGTRGGTMGLILDHELGKMST